MTIELRGLQPPILCGFCDASTHAYAAIIYLVVETDINTEVKFLVSKTRVAALQTDHSQIGATLSLSTFQVYCLSDGKPLRHSEPSCSDVLH